MPEDVPPDPARLLALTARIVSAQVRCTKLGAAELPGLVQSVRRALDGLTRGPAEAEPAVPVRRSVRPDAIACLECGARFKTLKRHLATDHGLTPEGYRARWGLPADYPMAAPDYADARSRLAKQAGLGRRRAPEAVPDVPAAESPAADSVPRGGDEGGAEPGPVGVGQGSRFAPRVGRQESGTAAAESPSSPAKRGRRKAAAPVG